MNQKEKPSVSYIDLVMPSNFHKTDDSANDTKKTKSKKKSGKPKKKSKDLKSENNTGDSKHKRNDANVTFDLALLGKAPRKTEDTDMPDAESTSISLMSIDEENSVSTRRCDMSIS
jgi:hypothetical protein